MNRQEVIDIMLSARTPEQITQAFTVYYAWMEEHPDDLQVRANCEMLDMLADAHGMIDYESFPREYYGGDEDENLDDSPTST